MREKLNALSVSEGITERIENFTGGRFSVPNEWIKANSDNLKIVRYEDLFGQNQKDSFKALFDHCRINIPARIMNLLLDRYSFRNITGRNLGTENKMAHYRKGVKGDWKNYFTKDQKILFKRYAGKLLIELGYEADKNW